MITIKVIVDGQAVASGLAKSHWGLPDVIGKTTRSFDHDPNLAFAAEEQVRDARGEVTEVIVRYQRAKPTQRAAA